MEEGEVNEVICVRCGGSHYASKCSHAPNTLRCNNCGRSGHVDSVCKTKIIPNEYRKPTHLLREAGTGNFEMTYRGDRTQHDKFGTMKNFAEGQQSKLEYKSNTARAKRIN